MQLSISWLSVINKILWIFLNIKTIIIIFNISKWLPCAFKNFNYSLYLANAYIKFVYRSMNLLCYMQILTYWMPLKVADFIFLGSKITANRDCSHEIKRCLLLGRKVMTNLDSELKSRDITLPTKVCLVKAMVFPVVMYGCETWTIKKAERWRIDAFELWYWRRLLRALWTARKSN